MIRLDSVSPLIQPILIDDWFTASPFGLIFESKIGKGKLLVSGDLLSDKENRPEARQHLYSLEKYKAGKSFNPKLEVKPERIKSLLQ